MPDDSMVAMRAALLSARDVLSFVRLSRTPKHADVLDGFITHVGDKWALVQTTRDGSYSDGWNAFRIVDVAQVKPHGETFETRVSERQPEWPPRAPFPLELDETADLLLSVPRSELIGIEKERRRAAVWIGQVVEVDQRRVRLHEVDPRARWADEPLGYRLGAISRVQLRSTCITALSSVIDLTIDGGWSPGRP
ncbi:hypothetical protein GCM10025783_32460 [Amnibacterium soli]|uniref:Uncharacterized protein n=2 Tax=Amnibacterium soli TaxID=1282736 RepID=A0ABP8ZIC9_9MICO